ncbi:MAG TPA: Na+/H+ antiporter NhaA [Beijerinckiaceae bacterium]|nr:Na+/H+ antiporter NhaA [Beijerinckiaceae bacterium]
MRERLGSTIRMFLASEAAGGLVLMGAAALALIIANSPLSHAYFSTLKAYLGGLSVLHWINDGLMAVFFLLVGLEIKREIISGELSTWGKRALPGLAALGGVVVPALIFLAFNPPGSATSRGWAIPTATDIAFALGVLALLGPRVPASLKIFLAALAIIDDLVAVLVIALFYTDSLSLPMLAGAGAVIAVLAVLNRRGVTALWPYLALGAVLWGLVLKSGVHATIAGVALAMMVPLRTGDDHPPLIRLEHWLHRPVAFLVVPVFGFANAGVSFSGIGPGDVMGPLPLGIALGLLLGKQIGVMLAAVLTVRTGLAPLPEGADMRSLYGVALLTGIGFTMSLFIGLLAFPASETLQNAVKMGVLIGSLASGLAGYLVLRLGR